MGESRAAMRPHDNQVAAQLFSGLQDLGAWVSLAHEYPHRAGIGELLCDERLCVLTSLLASLVYVLQRMWMSSAFPYFSQWWQFDDRNDVNGGSELTRQLRRNLGCGPCAVRKIGRHQNPL